MKLITTVVRPERLPQVKAALFRAGVTGVTISRVSGHGGGGGVHAHYRGGKVVPELRGKAGLQMAGSGPFVGPTIQADRSCAGNGAGGDGESFVLTLRHIICV